MRHGLTQAQIWGGISAVGATMVALCIRFEVLTPYTTALAVVKRHFPLIIGIGGVVMISLGALILTGEFTVLNTKAQELTSSLGLPSSSI